MRVSLARVILKEVIGRLKSRALLTLVAVVLINIIPALSGWLDDMLMPITIFLVILLTYFISVRR